MRHLNGLSDIAGHYDGFIIDLWGVIHDGVAPYAGARECLAQLRGRPVLLLSNAPRRAEPARQALRRLGIDNENYTDMLTSGEAAWLALRDRPDAWFAGLGNRLYHIGPERDRSVFDGLPLHQVFAPQDASFVLNTGPDDLHDAQSLAQFLPELHTCLDAGLKMLCANPDLEIVSGGSRILCAGALAAYYTSRGGDVRSIGKPDPAIYDQGVALMGIPRGRLLAIGDSLRTDIAGAAAAGIDAVWVLGGLHAAELGGDMQAIDAAASNAGLSPVAAMSRLVW
jgi:HAD superfamily hydrolase (TIGR01459 family)